VTPIRKKFWRETKKLTGQSAAKPELLSLINCVAAGGDAQLLAVLRNNSMQQVSIDL
jgi:hypothetical protein